MRRPDFFIVGAPKCGTTALSQYLSENPSIFMCYPKEPNFFTDFRFPRFRRVTALSDYLELFADATDSHRAVGEASASYLFIPEAISRLRDFRSDARIIVLLREPVSMVQAWHSQLVYTREEDEPDLEVAWGLQVERRKGLRLPRRCRDPRVLLYRDVASYAVHLEHLFSLFPHEQVLVLLLDDLASDPRSAYERTLEFLDVPSDRRTEFPKVNVAKVANDGMLWRWAAQPPDSFLRTARLVKRILGIKNRSFLTELRQQRARKGTRPPLAEEFRRQLAIEFREEIRRLERLIGRNLGSWTDKPISKG